jgi:hypothetical protein
MLLITVAVGAIGIGTAAVVMDKNVVKRLKV